MEILQWIATNLLTQVAILIGLITAIGLILQRRAFEEVVGGTLRAAIGVLIMLAGADIFVQGLVAFQSIVASAFRITPPQAAKTLAEFTAERGGHAAIIMTFGFLLHLILTRLLNVRFVYLTGHLMWWVSLTVTATLLAIMPNLSTFGLILIGTVVMALYWTLQPLYIHSYMRRVTGSDEFGYGHTSSSAAFLGALLGQFVGKPEESSEKLSPPKWLGFMKDINVSTGVVIGLIILVAAIFADPKVLAEQAKDLNPYVWAILQGLRFAAGIAVLLYGVRMFLAEIVPAFRGISLTVIPGARPALDVPVVFPYAPTAVILGFISGTVVFLVLMVVFGALGWATIVPPMIMLFFPGGGAGVFGNSTGGWKGALLGGAINGLFLAVGQAITWPMLSATAPELATLADPDWYLIIWILYAIFTPLRGLFGGA
ncbi:PTS ascorbate transporter subunit IIC [Thermoflexus sp.]|uniref:PTS ascorbate transporter subunit IIC n=1 Tax=Thermoflexus sp. TaxID=1969742 RepID=UPI002633B200|nr:PTS ascorbate transporter subunit IIC [Thermoflexus sp.]MCX7689989.1 PTS ascorbate transporter subunit IIC [Thermoflexus sp.]